MLAVPLAALSTPPAWAVSIPPAASSDPAPPATLADQFGNLDGPDRHRGKMVLLLYGTAPQLRRMKAWEVEVNRRSHEGMKVLRAVDARQVKGKKTEAEVAERLRKGVPPDVSVLVDWDGALATAYGLPSGEVSVTVIDPTGRPCGTEAGPVAAASAARVIDLIEKAGREGRCP